MEKNLIHSQQTDVILVIVDIHIINLDYLKNRSPHFIELLDGSTEELNKMLVGLDTRTVIPENNK